MQNKKAHLIVLTLFVLLCGRSAFASGISTGFLGRTTKTEGGTYRYQVYVPANYSPERKWPIVLFLHGADANGDDGIRQTEGVLGSAIRRHPERFPFLVVFPQCSANAFWVGPMVEQAMAALNQTADEFNGDRTRLYLTGYSMGGYGTWYMAAKYSGKFAAVVPVSGGILPPPSIRIAVPLSVLAGPDMASLVESADPYAAFARAIGKTPVWVFHGGADTNVPVTESRKIVAALKQSGGNVLYTEYEGGTHDSSVKAFGEPKLYSWLLAQQLGK